MMFRKIIAVVIVTLNKKHTVWAECSLFVVTAEVQIVTSVLG